MFALALLLPVILLLPLMVWAVGHKDRGKKP